MSEIFFKTIKGLSKLFKRFFNSENASRKNGFLQKLDARVKAVVFISLIVLSISLDNIPLLLVVFSFSIALAYLSKIELKMFFSRFIFIPLFSLIVVSPQLVMVKGQVLFGFFGLSVTFEGVVYVLSFLLRVTSSVSFITLLLMTTSFRKLIFSLDSMGLPKTGCFILLITYRYLFLFFSELHRMLVAREARFLNKKKLGFSWRSTRNLFGSFFIRALERGENVSLAMKSRGGRNSITKKTGFLDKKDVLFLLLSIVFVIVVGVVEWEILAI